MLTLLCGLSEAARSAYLTQAILKDIEAGRHAYLLVPEQQAYVSEKQFADLLPTCAGRYFEILTFSSLTDRVFRKHGGPEPTAAGGVARTLLMWDTLRELEPRLHCLGRHGKQALSLTEKALSAVADLQSSGIGEEQLGQAASALGNDPQLRDKLYDLIEIYPVFQKKCHEKTGLDASERLSVLAEKLRTAPFPEDTTFYFDSFTSFTHPEYQILRELMRGACQLTVSLCIDRPFSQAPQLASVANAAQRLLRIAKELGTEPRQLLLPEPPDEVLQSLCILRDHIWHFSAKEAAEPISDSGVTLTRAANRYEEAECCAEQILELIGSGERFGEIAILVRDPEAWRGILDAALEERGIPCFFSERTELASKPLSRLILSAVRAATRGYRTQDILTLLKTGLGGADLRDIALFEEYCETWHITGKQFCEPVWGMNPDGLTDRVSPRAKEILAAANRVRKTVMQPLQNLSAALDGAPDLSARCRAVYRYLAELGISEQLAKQAKHELALGQVKEAGETLRLYRFVTDCLTELTELLPNATPDHEAFLSLLSLFFEGADLGSVPGRQDCVVIGSAATARFAPVRSVFLLGLCEGEFPRSIAGGGLLSERDKAALDALGVRFYAREHLQNAEELFYVWRALRLPTRRLFLSCAATEADGSALSPSLAFTRAERLLGRRATAYQPTGAGRRVVQTDTLHARPLPDGTTLRLSQSSIQDFVLCPYRYYATHIMHLREKKDASLRATDEGTFLHFVFEQLLRRALRADGTLQLPTQAELPALADGIIGEYLTRVCPIPPDRMPPRLLHLFARLRELALLMLRDVVEELANSRFTPAAFEQTIGGGGANDLPEITFPLQNGSCVTLRGKVDRIDLWEHEGHIAVRVVDYKAGEHKFSWDEVRSGKDLQLVLYLFAALAADPEHRIPGGAAFLYAKQENGKTEVSRSGFLLDDEAVSGAADATPDSRYSKKLARCTQEEIAQLMQEMRSAVCTVAERILTGEAQKTPSEKACRFCPIADCCGSALQKKD